MSYWVGSLWIMYVWGPMGIFPVSHLLWHKMGLFQWGDVLWDSMIVSHSKSSNSGSGQGTVGMDGKKHNHASVPINQIVDPSKLKDLLNLPPSGCMVSWGMVPYGEFNKSILFLIGWNSALVVTMYCLGSTGIYVQTFSPDIVITPFRGWIFKYCVAIDISVDVAMSGIQTICMSLDRLHSMATWWPGILFKSRGCFSAGKESACKEEDLGLIPGLGRSPGKERGYPFQYSGLENSRDYIVHGVAKSHTWLRDFHSRKMDKIGPALWQVKYACNIIS